LNAQSFKEAYLQKGFSESVIDDALKKGKADFMERVVPQIKEKY
jgi:hypothetical protein